MKKQLIIAEKKSLAEKIVEGIKINDPSQRFVNKGLHFESQGYYVVYARGHVLELYDIEEYDPNYDPKKRTFWTLDNLPFVPRKFQFKITEIKYDKNGKRIAPKPDPYVESLLENIVELYKSDTVESVVNAGDAGREGTLIAYLVDWYAKKESGKSYPVYRLWSSDQTAPTLAKALKDMKPIQHYSNDIQEGFARMFTDWVNGINLTRYATLKAARPGTVISVGRVVTAITQAIYQRHMERKNFVPVKYWIASHKDEGFNLNSTIKHDTKEACDELVAKYNAATTVVTERESRDVVVNPPKLYSTTTLQNQASKLYNMTPKETSIAVESLYQKDLVTYPRTAAEYLFSTEKETVKELLKNFSDTTVFKDNDRIFNDKIIKDEDHSALLPLVRNPQNLVKNEQLIFDLIANRFQAVFCNEDHIVSRTTLKIDVGEYETFTLTGNITKQEGWTKFEEKKKDKELPNLQKGDVIRTNFETEEKETKPPALYTVTTLNNYLTNPFSGHEEYEINEDGLVIGTDATRSDTIEKAIKLNYISLKDKKYDITDFGIEVVETLEELKIPITVESTADLSRDLRLVKRGELKVNDILKREQQILIETIKEANVEVEKIGNEPKPKKGYVRTDFGMKKIEGKCFFCKGNVVDSPKAMSCNDCGITLWKENNKFFESMGVKQVTNTIARDFLTRGEHHFKKLKSKNTGKEFSATIKMEKDPTSKFPKFSFVTNDWKNKKK